MKYLIILADGAADEPIASLGNQTPLEAAATPHIDRMVREGVMGRLNTVPEGFHPGSEIANLGVLGYDVREVFEGRGSLEAASMGIDIEDGEVAMRCNFITVTPEGKIKNHSAGNVSNAEAAELIEFLNRELGDDRVRFYPGVSYRNLLKIRQGNKHVHCTPPHDEIGSPWADFLPQAECAEAQPTCELLHRLIRRSMEILPTHPVNQRRAAAGLDMANAIWPWSLGYRPTMQPMSASFPIRRASVISAVDLIFGIGVYAGLTPVHVEGATGLADTNYEGKAQAALEHLADEDFVFLHIEASDEAGHDGDAALKQRTVEYLDSRCVAPILEAVSTWAEPVRIALLPDHPTPCALRTHTRAAIPFVIWQSRGEGNNGIGTPDSTRRFTEREGLNGRFGLLSDDEFIRLFFS